MRKVEAKKWSFFDINFQFFTSKMQPTAFSFYILGILSLSAIYFLCCHNKIHFKPIDDKGERGVRVLQLLQMQFLLIESCRSVGRKTSIVKSNWCQKICTGIKIYFVSLPKSRNPITNLNKLGSNHAYVLYCTALKLYYTKNNGKITNYVPFHDDFLALTC